MKLLKRTKKVQRLLLKTTDQIYIYQSGFRRKHSTDFYLSQLTDSVLTGMDKKIHTLVDL